MPQNGWAISTGQIAFTYLGSLLNPTLNALFQPMDAANCPNDEGTSSELSRQFLTSHSQLLQLGNFRISLNAPNPLGPPGEAAFNGNTTPEWIMTVKADPTGCENDPIYGLPAGLVSVYRRPLPSANVAYLDAGGGGQNVFNIMWDAREPTLESQFIDATEFHGQTTISPGDADAAAGVAFQQGLFTAQSSDFFAGDLTGADGSGATGGPTNLFNLSLNVPPSNGIPIPGLCFFPEDLDGEASFCPGIFGIPTVFFDYASSGFANATGRNRLQNSQRQSIARGETIFNTTPFTINDVVEFNDVPGACGGLPTATNPCTGQTCSTCHNNQNVGNDNFLDPKRTGIMDNSNNTNNALPATSDFPLFAFYCPTGSITFFSNSVTSANCQLLPGAPTSCDEFDTTDPGLGLITGLCADLGKMKVPVLRGLASRAPYFHGGNVHDLKSLVKFYKTRFSIGLTKQQQADLVNFLNTL